MDQSCEFSCLTSPPLKQKYKAIMGTNIKLYMLNYLGKNVYKTLASVSRQHVVLII